MYPATYVWRVNLRQQKGYYCNFYWGPASGFDASAYYGAPPYPDGSGDKSQSLTHKWSIGSSGRDNVTDANGHSTQLGYDTWKTQSLRVYDNGVNKVHEFYWDLPDTTKVIRALFDRSYGSRRPASPALTVGDAPYPAMRLPAAFARSSTVTNRSRAVSIRRAYSRHVPRS